MEPHAFGDSGCIICTRPGSRVLEYTTETGRVKWLLCDPCLASRVSQQWQPGRDFIVDGTAIKTQDLSQFVKSLPKKQKCAACGSRCNEAHWHFANNGNGKGSTRDGRRYYCDRQCCTSVNCASRDDDDWDLDWGDEADEDIGWDDEDEAAVVGSTMRFCDRCSDEFSGTTGSPTCPACHAKEQNPDAWEDDEDEWDF